MENIWEEMQRQYGENAHGKEEEEKKVPEPQMKIRFSPNCMQAFFSLVVPSEWDEAQYKTYILTEAEVIAFLQKQQVEHGILHDKIRNYCQRRLFGSDVQVAQGTAAIPGEDGTYTLHVETQVTGKPKELDDGRVDYHQLDLIRTVMAGDVLCTVVHPTPGTDGCDVFGKPVRPRAGIPAAIRTGKNVAMVEREDDTTLLTAETDGRVELKMGCLMVENIYLVIGDVGPKTGHVEFKGSVKVVGNALEGFNITAQQDVHITGRVEGCIINAGGNVVIEDGVAGMDKAIISVKGNFTSRFLENATVICGGDVFCDIALRSFIKAVGSVYMAGQRGALVGGECLAGNEIVVRTMGSQRNLTQTVSVLPGWQKTLDLQEDFLEEPLQVDLEESLQVISALKERLEECQKDAEATKKLVLNGDFTSISKMKKLLDMRVQIEKQINEVRHQVRYGVLPGGALQNAKERKDKEEQKQAKISCRGTVYPGVHIFVEHESLLISDEIKYCFFMKDNDNIYVGNL